LTSSPPRGSSGIAIITLLATSLLLACGRPAGPGLRVEAVEATGALARAGLRTGDVLVSWRRAGSAGLPATGGTFETPFDVDLVEVEQAPRGALTVSVRRGGVRLTLAPKPGPWGVTTRPGPGENALHECRAQLAAGEAAAAGRRFGDAESALAAAARCADAAGRPDVAALVHHSRGDAFRGAQELGKAEEAHRQALALREKAGTPTLSIAASLARVAETAQERGLEHGVAELLWRRSLAMREELAPGSLEVSASHQGLGDVFHEEGRVLEAEEEYRKALGIRETLAPGTVALAETLTGLGGVAQLRGDLAGAEALHRRALALKERLAPGSAEVAGSLNKLGLVAEWRGEMDAAESLYRRALAIHEALAPRSLAVAGCLNNVGNVAARRGEHAAAKALYERSLAIRESLGRESLPVAGSINNLGDLARERGDLDEAERLLRRALALKERIAPGTTTVAVSLWALAEVAAERGLLTKAEALHRRALGIWSRLAPGGPREAGALRSLAGVLQRQKRSREAEDAYRRAIAILEGIRGRLGGSGDQSGFGAVYAPYFQELAELLLEQGRAREAFHCLERSRARGLLAMLAERDMVFADLPPDVERRRRRLDAEADRARSQLARLVPGKEDAAIESLQATLGRLEDERARIVAEIRAASPRLAALQYPRPLDLAGVRASLDPGTLLLFYSVGRERSFVFVITAASDGAVGDAGLEVHDLGIGRDALADRVAVFRGLVDRHREGPLAGTPLATQAARLHELLLRPAESRIERAERLLVVADGPLHALPFAALATTRLPQRSLVEWKPLHTVASATVYAELRQQRRSAAALRGPQVEAFGDPEGRRPLPHSREEVRRIASLYGAQAATYLGPDATEERVRALRAARYVHFASHGVLDRRFPLESGIELAVLPGAREGHDGVLHAWEVFERVRIDADLVTLSACETGLGREWPGEGLVGLARAFQYAGARSVLASLWAVEDRSTAVLMDTFYRALHRGLTKDEALREAQVGSSRAGEPPFRWAAFQLSGDWR
jgi:tetratricopeptide (TPR) repeat protein